jgi:hypothetical protein
VSARGDPVFADVSAVVARGGAAAYVLLNPDFFGTESAALGVADRTARLALRESFEDVFYLRTLAEVRRPALVAVERGALLRCWPGRFGLWRLAGGRYELVREFGRLPSRAEVTDALEVPAVRRDPAAAPAFGPGDRAYLQTLLALAVLASSAFYVLRHAAAYQPAHLL